MIVNFKAIDGRESGLHDHAVWLAEYDHHGKGDIGTHEPPVGFKSFVSVDVVGSEFKWMNKTFSKGKFTWYLWFESIFLVPKEMVPFLTLRWSE